MRLAVSVIGQFATLLFVVGSHPMSPAAATTGSVAAAAGWAIATAATKATSSVPKRTRTLSAAPADVPKERRRPERIRDAMLHRMEKNPPCSGVEGPGQPAAGRSHDFRGPVRRVCVRLKRGYCGRAVTTN